MSEKSVVSDTPRTDAEEIDNSHFSDWGIGPSGMVYAEVARILERENTRLSAKNEKLLELLRLMDRLGGQGLEMHERIAALLNECGKEGAG